MRKVQDTKTEAQGRVLEYVTEAECRKERSNLRTMTLRYSLFYPSKTD
ncbi:hypothetical protein [Porphyromonas macacae]|nr:hypothetical protein [Porphyromonas macacae]